MLFTIKVQHKKTKVLNAEVKNVAKTAVGKRTLPNQGNVRFPEMNLRLDSLLGPLSEGSSILFRGLTSK